MASRTDKPVFRSLILSLTISGLILLCAFLLIPDLNFRQLLSRLLWPLTRLMLVITIGLIIGQIIEATGWTKTLAALARPLFRFGRLGDHCGAAFTAAFFSGVAANAMLLNSYQDGKITRKQLFLSNFVNQLPAFFLHLPTTFFIVIPLTGWAGGIYFLITFAAVILRTVLFLVYGHFELSPAVIEDGQAESGESSRKAKTFKDAWQRIKSLLPRRIAGIAVYVIPIYILVYILNAMGTFQLLRETLSGFVVTAFMPMESLSVIILSFAAEFTSGFAAAGALLEAGVLTIKQTVIALLIGNILAFPVRALRHQLPRYIGIFSPKMGSQILLLGQGFRIISIMVLGILLLLSRINWQKNFVRDLRPEPQPRPPARGHYDMILEGKKPSRVRIRLLTGDDIMIAIHSCRLRKRGEAICSVIKDAGDDPDVTHKAEIGARVALLASDKQSGKGQRPQIIISGGEGVGRVTKPGLEVEPGQPAINPGPKKMITQAIEEVLKEHHLVGTVRTEIFVPQGKKLAEKTLNARLGILGGISILGTTGVVRPMSHDAFIATIESALSVARACGLKRVVLTTGRRSERFAQDCWGRIPSEAFIQIGDFFKLSLESAAKRGFVHITLAVFFGKALKMAQGVPHTHAAKSSLTLDKLSGWTMGDNERFRIISKNFSSQHCAACI